MAISSRRLARGLQKRAVQALEANLYTAKTYTGTVLKLTQSQNGDLPSTHANNLYSISLSPGAKVYIYSKLNRNGEVRVVKNNMPDVTILKTYHIKNQTGWVELMPFADYAKSVEIRALSYTPPQAAGLTVELNDSRYDSYIDPVGQSTSFSNVDVQTVTENVQHQETRDYFFSIVPQAKLRDVFVQTSRNVCHVLYDTPDGVPTLFKNITLSFVEDPNYGVASYTESNLKIGNAVLGSSMAFEILLAHELTHFYQYLFGYGKTEFITGTVEGIATLVENRAIKGRLVYPRPDGGGNNWYDGYETTAYFFDYIERYAAVKTPNFLRRLNATLSPANYPAGVSQWEPEVIASIQTEGKDVDTLWSEYKTWVASLAGLRTATANTLMPDELHPRTIYERRCM